MQVGAFFAVGSLALVSPLSLVDRATPPRCDRAGGGPWPGVPAPHGRRMRPATPATSALAIGLTASACFLIAAVSVFRIDTARQTVDRNSGAPASGGFTLIGQSELPIHFDLDTPQGRKESGFDPDQEDLLAQCRFFSFRVEPGDEASCLNLSTAAAALARRGEKIHRPRWLRLG